VTPPPFHKAQPAPTYQCVTSLTQSVPEGVHALCLLKVPSKKHTEFPRDVLNVLRAQYTVVRPDGSVWHHDGDAVGCAEGGGDVGGEGAAGAVTTAPVIAGLMVIAPVNEITEIPDALCSPAVFSLDLGCNKLASLSPAIAHMTHITSLDVRNNQIEAFPPQSIECMAHLEYLNVRNNRLTKLPILPPSLEELYAGDNKINDIRAALAAGLPRLRVLVLGGNVLTAIPPSIVRLTRLEELDLRLNKIDQFAPQIGALASLKTLTLFGNNLTRIPREIGGLISLAHLDVLRNDMFYMAEDSVYKALMKSGTRAAVRMLRCELKWRVFFHRSCSLEMRAAIFTALLSGNRRAVAATLPWLPLECWWMILENLPMQWGAF